ncbi:MAG: hypothetical protein ACI9VR_003899 [Cognaticolwellia sp.]|jgi:hypothetical protein
MFLLALLVSLLSCRRGDTQDSEVAGVNPWLDHPVQEVDGFRLMLVTELPVGDSKRLVSVPSEPLLLVQNSGDAWILDDRYEIREKPACLDPDRFPDVEYRSEFQGDCEAGEVELARGRAPALVAAADDVEGNAIWGVGLDGKLYRTSYDLRVSHPWDWLRPTEVADLGRLDVVAARFGAEGLQLLAGSELLNVDTRSFEVSSRELPGTGTVFSNKAIGTKSGLIVNGELETGAEVLDIADSAEGRWVALGENGLVGPQGETLPDAAYRIAVAERGVYVLGELGLWRVEDGAAELLLKGSYLDVVALPSHEIVVLADGEVQVYVDERPLLEGPPLSIWVQTFLEKPRTRAEDVPCGGSGDTVEGFVRSAASNARLLNDIPGTIALDVSPFYAERVLECELASPVQGLLERRDLEIGVLYHEGALCRGDATCLQQYLEDGLAQVEELSGLVAGHVSGLSPIYDDGDDWVEGLVQSNVPRIVTFVGMSLLPDVVHTGDPRAKERWPLEMADMATPWAISSSDMPDKDSGGPVRILPSNTRAAFSQEGCGSMLLRECFGLNLGAGLELSERDVAQLDLSLHRALAFRGEQGVWSFHMPDLGSWDYVQGCDDDWEGDCDAARFRSWLIDVHARWVQSGAAEWSLPAQHE